MHNITIENVKTQIKNGNASYENKTKALEYIDSLLTENASAYLGEINLLKQKVASLTRETEMTAHLIVAANSTDSINVITNQVIHWQDLYNIATDNVAELHKELATVKEHLETTNSVANQLSAESTRRGEEINKLKEQITNFNTNSKTLTYIALFKKMDAISKERNSYKDKYETILKVLKGFGIHTIVTDAITE